MIQKQLPRETVLELPDFNKWYFIHLPRMLNVLQEKVKIREKIENKKQNQFRVQMSKRSELKVFFTHNKGKTAKVLKDINIDGISLYKGERIVLDSEDMDMINAIAFKIPEEGKITDVLMLLNI